MMTRVASDSNRELKCADFRRDDDTDGRVYVHNFIVFCAKDAKSITVENSDKESGKETCVI